jgi:hypothetical protein
MSTPGTQPQTAGWYPDPAGSGGHRWHDGQGWTAQVVHGSAVEKTLGQGFARMGDWLGRLLVVQGVYYLLVGLLVLFAWVGGAGAFAPTDGSGGEPLVPATPDAGSGSGGTVALAIEVVFLGGWLVAIVLWLVWQYQLAVAAPRRLKHSPAGHVFWWFVPVASLVVPRRAIGELWHAYSTRRTGDPAEPTPWVFSVWWALWIAPALLLPVMVVLMLTSPTPDRVVSVVLGVTTLMTFAQAGAALAARAVVRDLSWRALLYFADAR